MNGWILPLAAEENTLNTAGGKGANLARLLRLGFPVPGGFVVSTAAYRTYVQANHLVDVILSATDRLAADNPAGLAEASASIRTQFSAGTVPPALGAALREAYRSLGGAGRQETSPVAVRSSATAEDLPDLSFAGQQDTYLNIVGYPALLEAVVNCWSSLWTARAMGYRARNGISGEDLALAVVVQEMVPSEASGVLFTANPLDGKRTEMVIEATLGLGEALVSGRVEPDRYLVEAASSRILSKTLGAKAVQVQTKPGGGTATHTEDATTRQALTDAAIEELAQLGRRIAEAFGTPQDVEWAWTGGQLYLLQSRPITSLFPLPAGMEPEPLQVMFSFGAVQGLLEPMTPLGRDTIQAVFAGAGRLFGYRLTPETQNAAQVAGERLFVNITGLLRHPFGQRLIRAALGFIEPGASQSMETLLDDLDLGGTCGFSLRTTAHIVAFVVPALGRLLLSLLRPEAQRNRFQGQLESAATDLEARMAAATGLAERVALMEESLQGAFPYLLPRFVPRFGAGMAALNLLNHLAASLPGSAEDTLVITRGLPHNVTTKMDLALWETAQQIEAVPETARQFRQGDPSALAADYVAGHLPEQAQNAIAHFLGLYGMRGPGEIDLGRPRWREQPTTIVEILQSYMRLADPSQAPDAVFARGAGTAEAAIEHLAQSVGRTKGGWLKARLVRWAARRTRALAGLRESPKFWAIRLMGLVRAALLESGQELAASRQIDQPDDLFFLHLPELRALAGGAGQDWRPLVHRRRQAYANEQRRRQIPRLLLSNGQAFYEGVASTAADGEGVLVGSPVSPGVVEGIVRVVFDPRSARLAPGEILVCPGTDPAWTPLFLVAGGLVMEVGGMMTHGSVVAREYGIPAVVGVTRATARLRTGQRVQVDGTAGRVIVQDSGSL